jgi:hypothetical protein
MTKTLHRHAAIHFYAAASSLTSSQCASIVSSLYSLRHQGSTLFVLPFLDIGNAPGHAACLSNSNAISKCCRNSDSGFDRLLCLLEVGELSPYIAGLAGDPLGSTRIAVASCSVRTSCCPTVHAAIAGSSVKVSGGVRASWLGALLKTSSMASFDCIVSNKSPVDAQGLGLDFHLNI